MKKLNDKIDAPPDDHRVDNSPNVREMKVEALTQETKVDPLFESKRIEVQDDLAIAASACHCNFAHMHKLQQSRIRTYTRS